MIRANIVRTHKFISACLLSLKEKAGADDGTLDHTDRSIDYAESGHCRALPYGTLHTAFSFSIQGQGLVFGRFV